MRYTAAIRQAPHPLRSFYSDSGQIRLLLACVFILLARSITCNSSLVYIISAVSTFIIKVFISTLYSEASDNRISLTIYEQAWAICPTLLAWCSIYITAKWFLFNHHYQTESDQHQSCANDEDMVQRAREGIDDLRAVFVLYCCE